MRDIGEKGLDPCAVELEQRCLSLRVDALDLALRHTHGSHVHGGLKVDLKLCLAPVADTVLDLAH